MFTIKEIEIKTIIKDHLLSLNSSELFNSKKNLAQ